LGLGGEGFIAKVSNEDIYEAVYRWGYKLGEGGEFLGLNYSRASRIASRVAKSKT